MKPIKTRIEYGIRTFTVYAIYADGTEKKVGDYKSEKLANIAAYYCTFGN